MPLYSVFAKNANGFRAPEHPHTGAIPFPRPWCLLRDADGVPVLYVVRADTESGRVDRYDVFPDVEFPGRMSFRMDLAQRPVVISETRPAPLKFDAPTEQSDATPIIPAG